ncbi:MAG: 3-oxoacyl-ACP synthase III [Xanthomonadaceae bacterium]|jgi:3-oxoacyl-[acyl-carrier-protein] synthase-3|nr:3-oxoacyl-ACP synthase III [Xanthomonadaceae bacterium]
MLYKNVAIAGLAHVDAPITLTSDEINQRLRPTLGRLGIKADVLRAVAGIHSRRMWDEGTRASDAATLAGRKAMEDAGIEPSRVGLLINTSVSRDYLEPSTASIVAGNLGLGGHCQSFDIANACLAFINGMDVAARMIEYGEIDYALVVDAETMNLVYEKTLERMSDPNITEEQFNRELATLTLGSGAAAMVLAHRDLVPDAPRYKGGITRSASEWNQLCRGNPDMMISDPQTLMVEGIRLAQKTFDIAKQALGWVVDELDQFVIHQVSKVHTRALIRAIGMDAKKVMTIFGDHGNIGPAGVPIVLSKLKELGKLKKGDRIALVGVGSGLNCTIAEVVW